MRAGSSAWELSSARPTCGHREQQLKQNGWGGYWKQGYKCINMLAALLAFIAGEEPGNEAMVQCVQEL